MQHFKESLVVGAMTAVVGLILSRLFQNDKKKTEFQIMICLFFTGVIVHLLYEQFEVHTYFK